MRNNYIPRALMYLASAVAIMNNSCVTTNYTLEERITPKIGRTRANQPMNLEGETLDKNYPVREKAIEIKPYQEKQDNNPPRKWPKELRMNYV